MVWLDMVADVFEEEVVGTEVLEVLPMATHCPSSSLDVVEESEEGDSEIATIVGIIPAPAWNTTSVTGPTGRFSPPAYCPV